MTASRHRYFDGEKAAYRGTAVAAVFLLDTFTTSTGGYSFRQLKTGATKAVRIRRASDNAEQDFAFDGSGNFDATGAATFLTATTGFITTMYDQSGNARDMVQATAGLQPTYSASAGPASKPSALYTTGSNIGLRSGAVTSNNFVTVNDAYIISVFNASADGTIFGDWGDSLHSYVQGGSSRVLNYEDDGAAKNVLVTTFAYNTSYIVDYTHVAGTTMYGKLSGQTEVSLAAGTNLGTLTASNMAIGSNSSFTTATSYISEVVFWNADPGRASVRSNLSTYYGLAV